MKQTSAALVFALAITSSHVALANEAKLTGEEAADCSSNVLKAIPIDAVAFLSIPSMSVLDRDYQQAIENLGVAPFFQPPMNSPLAMIKAYLPNLVGLDPDGSLSLVVMPFTSPLEIQMKTVLFLPAKEPKKLVESLGGQSVADGVWMVTLGGVISHAIVRDQHVLLGMLPDVLNSVKESKGSITSTMPASDREVLNDLNIYLWLRSDAILHLFKEQFDSALQPLGKTVDPKYQLHQTEIWLKGTKSMALGVAADDRGFLARGGVTLTPGSALAKQMVGKNTSSLLSGLPTSKYIIAAGQTVNPEQIQASIDSLVPLIEQLPTDSKETLKAFEDLRKEVSDWLSLTSQVQYSVEQLPDGTDGLLGAAIVVESTNAKRWIEKMENCMAVARKVRAGFGAEVTAKLFSSASYNKAAEELAGVKVHQLKVDLTDIDEEESENTEELFGSEGLLLRIAPADDKKVVFALGGGATGATKLIESAKKGEKSLTTEVSVKKVTASLPKEKNFVLYLRLDRAMTAINRILDTIEEKRLPVVLPELADPIVVSSSVGKNSIRIDFLAPTQVVVTAAQAVVALFMTFNAGSE